MSDDEMSFVIEAGCYKPPCYQPSPRVCKPKPCVPRPLPLCREKEDNYEDEIESLFASEPRPGCIDDIAVNFDPLATVDDGSCTYPPIPGCTDPTATNYDPAATADYGCVYPALIPDCPDGGCVSGSVQMSPGHGVPTYLTADQAVSHQTRVSQAVSSVSSQDPDGIGWLSWSGTEWDGKPVDARNMTRKQLCEFLRPTKTKYVVRGLRDKFYAVKPFADNRNPTVREIEDWNLVAINHIREMLGYPVQVKHDPRLYLEARWADERKFTRDWDNAYPDAMTCSGGSCIGRAPGPCHDAGGNRVDLASNHCGASFFPDPVDREPYISGAPYFGDFVKYPELENYNSRVSKREAVSAVNTDLPWSIKVATMMTSFICGEGTTGHAGSFLEREYVGIHWHIWSDGPTGTRGRFKWR